MSSSDCFGRPTCRLPCILASLVRRASIYPWLSCENFCLRSCPFQQMLQGLPFNKLGNWHVRYSPPPPFSPPASPVLPQTSLSTIPRRIQLPSSPVGPLPPSSRRLNQTNPKRTEVSGEHYRSCGRGLSLSPHIGEMDTHRGTTLGYSGQQLAPAGFGRNIILVAVQPEGMTPGEPGRPQPGRVALKALDRTTLRADRHLYARTDTSDFALCQNSLMPCIHIITSFDSPFSFGSSLQHELRQPPTVRSSCTSNLLGSSK